MPVSGIQLEQNREEAVSTLRIPLLAAALAAGLWAQTTEKPLTNGDIESMLTSGLPESTIVLKIEDAAYRGMIDLDASPAALGTLKQRGASERLLNAVLWAEPAGGAWKQKQEEDRAVPDLPRAAGLYFKNPSGWIDVGSFLWWTPFDSAWAWMRGRRQYSVSLSDSAPELRLSEAQPTFYVREPSSEGPWRIIRLTTRKNQRLVRMSTFGGLVDTGQIPGNQVRDARMMHVAGGIYTVRPAAALEAGEYVLCAEVPGGPGLNLCYSFAIQQ